MMNKYYNNFNSKSKHKNKKLKILIKSILKINSNNSSINFSNNVSEFFF